MVLAVIRFHSVAAPWRVESGEWRVESGEWRVVMGAAQLCGLSDRGAWHRGPDRKPGRCVRNLVSGSWMGDLAFPPSVVDAFDQEFED